MMMKILVFMLQLPMNGKEKMNVINTNVTM